MLIGRTDDPQNPCRVAAFEVTNPFGCGSRNPSGPAVIVPRQIGRTHDRFSHKIRFFSQTPLHSKGRPHTPYERLLLPSSRARSAWWGGVGGGGCFRTLIGRRIRGETPTPNPSPPLRGGRREIRLGQSVGRIVIRRFSC